MNGVHLTYRAGLPATSVIQVRGDRPLASRSCIEAKADEVLLAAVSNRPRAGQTKPISALLPEVLARYGLAENADEIQGVDLLA